MEVAQRSVKYKYISFSSIQETEQYKTINFQYLNDLTSWVLNIYRAEYSYIWLNQNTPSFIAGYNSEDKMTICIPLLECQSNR